MTAGTEPFDTSFPDFPSTLYPVGEPGGGVVMRNVMGIRDRALLQQVEYVVADRVRDSIQSGAIPIERTFDLEHARQLHKALFSDLYPNWAGEVRPFGMNKGGGQPFAQPNQIDHYWRNATEAIRTADLPAIGREDFVSTLATVYANINQAHFGREGNGRTGKLFLEHVAEQSPFELDFHLVDKAVWNEQSERSRPEPGYLGVRPAELVAVFDQITLDRAQPAPVQTLPLSPELQRIIDVNKRNFPTSATEIGRPTQGSPAEGRGYQAPGQGHSTGKGYGR
ncbi:cell filamentation protein Fic (plasmid) [Cryobacterium sp. LW097]|nr:MULTISPECIES: Fic family protein [unclassified Cryobacterium]ASD24271.1 cell filamentation protein Fic [Cryobacterium sp. LW097]TFC52844.1 cell filamentation protein Fic [Cryobacterium sp. TMB3-1-2]TFC62215.1 cell filamentation protein Fic [Cryobacterium sp. TMB1-7]TFC70694.1 cell filamentation protein Fic [Cryobacterium sp. TMB3-15]TFC75420.1 cell filamentation protein Fic [Cryobacterium sp. TMB3-10]